MSKYYPKQAGTTEKVFTFGLADKATLDFSSYTTDHLLKFPDSDGGAGYVLSTDGSGTLSWVLGGAGGGVDLMPYYIPGGDTYTVNTYRQGLFTLPITIDGSLTLDGILVEV